MARKIRIGAISDLTSAAIAIRDLEQALSELQERALITEETGFADHKVPVAIGGEFGMWTIESAGGCTITFDGAHKKIKISVP